MRKKHYLVVGSIILFVVLTFQIFFRYEIAEIGSIDLKYDRLTSRIYMRPYVPSTPSLKNPQGDWIELELKDFRVAKVWAFRNQVENINDDIEARLDDIEIRLDELELDR